MLSTFLLYLMRPFPLKGYLEWSCVLLDTLIFSSFTGLYLKFHSAVFFAFLCSYFVLYFFFASGISCCLVCYLLCLLLSTVLFSYVVTWQGQGPLFHQFTDGSIPRGVHNALYITELWRSLLEEMTEPMTVCHLLLCCCSAALGYIPQVVSWSSMDATFSAITYAFWATGRIQQRADSGLGV